MLVYLADFCHRRGLSYQRAYETKNPERTYENPQDGVVAAPGDLDRSVL